VLDTFVIPISRERIEDIKSSAGGFLPGNWQAYRGGAAVVLKDITPPLKPGEIRDRIERQRLQPAAGATQTQQSYRDFAIESPNGPEQPTNVAVVLVSDPLLPYDRDPGKWRDDLAIPVWKLIGDSINKPATLQKVSNFDPQVAGDTARDAIMALILSVAVIMAYIWVRFGDLKYGTATMIAMLHDTLLVLAAIGLSHLLYHYAHPLASGLLLEPFRLNITVVAAVLTVMSYSMIDTIVVFDRVRENRGKFGDLNRKTVNDSINQTMSRTLLTAGTNIVTLFFMYVFGGPGIHGFTFVLLFGILIGTYSSVAIAAPLLLVGKKRKSVAVSGFPVGQKPPATVG
jgi:SecD/SecF fusion protein